MIKSLCEVAEVKTGYYTQPDIDGDLYYIQTKHFNDNNLLEQKLLTKEIKYSINIQKYIIEDKSILFSSKGRYFAYLFDKDSKDSIASSSFFIIKVKEPQIAIPEFITWYLNLEESMKFYQKAQKGTSLNSITMKALCDLKISLPDLNTQKKILDFYKLFLKEKELNLKLLNKKEVFYQYKLLKLIKESVNA